MVPPYVESNDPKFHLQINGEALWHWRKVCGHPCAAFDVLQASISRIGYKLEESARDRVGHAIAKSIRNFWRKINEISNSKKRKRVFLGFALQAFAIGYFELPLVQTILLKCSIRSSEQDPIRAVFIFCIH